jgi:nucleotide-binding universal stress UspA family protein
VPVVVTRSASLPRRVLAAVDTSAAARVTLEAAERWTDTCGAELRVLSVVELLPVTTEMPFGYTDPAVYSGYYESARTAVERDVWPLVKRDAHKQLRFGRTLDTIVDEAETWAADLLVVGTHGRGWVERTLLGSVAEGLLHALPTSLLVVPAHAVLAAQATSKR